jgi:hypothetical protein
LPPCWLANGSLHLSTASADAESTDRLASGALVVVSPIALSDALATAVEALGHVDHLVAPNRLHHLYMDAWRARYPQARLFAPASLAEKRPDLKLDEPLDEGAPAAWGGEIDALLVRGAPSIDEVVLLHRPSRTLWVTDLVFNLTRSRGVMSALVFALIGISGRLAQSRVWRFAIKDREAAAQSAQQLLSWDFDRIMPAHGELVEQATRSVLAAALVRMRAASRE